MSNPSNKALMAAAKFGGWTRWRDGGSDYQNCLPIARAFDAFAADARQAGYDEAREQAAKICTDSADAWRTAAHESIYAELRVMFGDGVGNKIAAMRPAKDGE